MAAQFGQGVTRGSVDKLLLIAVSATMNDLAVDLAEGVRTDLSQRA